MTEKYVQNLVKQAHILLIQNQHIHSQLLSYAVQCSNMPFGRQQLRTGHPSGQGHVLTERHLDPEGGGHTWGELQGGKREHMGGRTDDTIITAGKGRGRGENL